MAEILSDQDIEQMPVLAFVVQADMWRDVVHCPEDQPPKKWIIEASKKATPVVLAVVEGAHVPGLFEQCFVIARQTFKRCGVYPDGNHFCDACVEDITRWFDFEMAKARKMLETQH